MKNLLLLKIGRKRLNQLTNRLGKDKDQILIHLPEVKMDLQFIDLYCLLLFSYFCNTLLLLLLKHSFWDKQYFLNFICLHLTGNIFFFYLICHIVKGIDCSIMLTLNLLLYVFFFIKLD